jgi:Domain of unknown function (DUF3859)
MQNHLSISSGGCPRCFCQDGSSPAIKGYRIKRWIVALIALGAMYQSSFAQTPVIKTVEIVAYGIYSADLQSSQRDTQGVLQNVSQNFRLVTATTAVPAQIGTRFGFNYKVGGTPTGKTVSLKKVTVYPPEGLRSPNVAQSLKHSDTTVTPTIGQQSYAGYRFDDPWELVPGQWRMELWDGDRKVAEQTFTVTATKP